MSKLVATMINDYYKARGKRDDITWFTNKGDAPTEIGQSEPQSSNVAGTSRTPTQPLTTAP